jgi:adenylate cyclase
MSAKELDILEHSLALDPSYWPALAASAYYLVEWRIPVGTFGDIRRAETRVRKAHEIAPKALGPAYVQMFWLKNVGRCAEAIEIGRQLLRDDPAGVRLNTGIYSQLGQCLTQSGHAEDDIALQHEVMDFSPGSSYLFDHYRSIGYDQVLLGQDADAIASLRRAVALNTSGTRRWSYLLLAAAYARTGQVEAAEQARAVADGLWPYQTARGVDPNYSDSSVYRDQIRRLQDALRATGERDHADEDTDFGVESDQALHDLIGRTPRGAPGATTIRTVDLPRLIAEQRPVVIDAMTFWWGVSLPGAIGLRFSGLGGDFSDEAQERLRSKMRELTGGDAGRPIIAVGWNSERFDGRNLALRLVALGYQRVYWYRGGREAWEAAGLPEAAARVDAW